MRTLALLGGLFFFAVLGACGGAKGLPKGPAPEYEEDPVPDAGATPAPPPAAPAADAAPTSAAMP